MGCVVDDPASPTALSRLELLPGWPVISVRGKEEEPRTFVPSLQLRKAMMLLLPTVLTVPLRRISVSSATRPYGRDVQ
jgi:hypothetical protein